MLFFLKISCQLVWPLESWGAAASWTLKQKYRKIINSNTAEILHAFHMLIGRKQIRVKTFFNQQYLPKYLRPQSVAAAEQHLHCRLTKLGANKNISYSYICISTECIN